MPRRLAEQVQRWEEADDRKIHSGSGSLKKTSHRQEKALSVEAYKWDRMIELAYKCVTRLLGLSWARRSWTRYDWVRLG
jgi:hypothetical protein